MWLFLTPIIAKHLKSRNRTREVLDKCEREEIIPRRKAHLNQAELRDGTCVTRGTNFCLKAALSALHLKFPCKFLVAKL